MTSHYFINRKSDFSNWHILPCISQQSHFLAIFPTISFSVLHRSVEWNHLSLFFSTSIRSFPSQYHRSHNFPLRIPLYHLAQIHFTSAFNAYTKSFLVPPKWRTSLSLSCQCTLFLWLYKNPFLICITDICVLTVVKSVSKTYV